MGTVIDYLDFIEKVNPPEFFFEKKDMLVLRTGTNGFQPKFFTKDKKYFIKAQANISGVFMEDWLVEIIASQFCEQLSIPVVKQCECKVHFSGHTLDSVYSDNFELDGYSFISFEALLSSVGKTTKSDEYIKLGTVDKMKWAAKMLSEIGKISYIECENYVVNLAIIDILVGNMDRHTHNFGLFYNNLTGEYGIPLIFDSGMGLFENDGYRDAYTSYESVMRTAYVAPYGEDPFDMLNIIYDNFDLSRFSFEELTIPSRFPNKFSKEYINNIFARLKELGLR